MRFVAELAPHVSVDHLECETQVSFLPLECVWADSRYDPSRTRPLAEVASGYTRFMEGDVLVPKITPTFEAARSAIARGIRAGGPGFGTTELHVLRPGPALDSRYLWYRTLARDFISGCTASMVGVAGQKRVPADQVKNCQFRLPSLDEQRRIADFLDDERDVFSFSETRVRRLRGLLQQRVVASLSSALHCGRLLSADSVLPADWRLIRLKFLAQLQSGVTLGTAYPATDLVERPYLRVANVQDGRVDLANVSTIAVPGPHVSRYELRPGDVLMTEGGDNDKLGRGAVWKGEIAGCLHQNHVFAVRPDQTRLRPEYLAAAMASTHGKAYFQSTAHQTTNLASTNSAKLMDFPIPLPPPEEQDRLVQDLHAGRGRALRLDAVLREQLQLLAERRDSLITGAVTGQLDPSSYRASAVAA